MTVFFHTLGCKVNQYESEEMLEALLGNGYTPAQNAENADIIVINSCTVTAESDRKSRQSVRKYRKLNPNAITVLTGCMPQAYKNQAEELPEADIVLGNNTNFALPEMIEKFLSSRDRIINISEHINGEVLKGNGINRFEERTRAFLKIEDGCDRFCSYCAIPYARGRVRSKSIEQIESEIESLAKNGFVEIVLVGINLSAYGKDLCNADFPQAVKAASDTDGILRVRLGSLEPDHITDEVIEKLSEIDKLCPQFHISLQSGSDNTLKSMNRHYTSEEYLSLCQKLRGSFPNCTLTTDIMVGFPGETENNFKETVDFVKKIGFEKVHIFPYSVRKGTRAAEFDNQITSSEKAERAAKLASVCEKIRTDFLKEQIGKNIRVLIEKEEENGDLFGYTDNYIPVKISGGQRQNGIMLDVTVTGSDSEFCYAE